MRSGSRRTAASILTTGSTSMTSGPINKHLRYARRAGGWLALALLSLPASGFAQNATLDQVMALLAQRKHGEVKYVEEDYLKILDQPVKSSGVLVYEAPDHLEKRAL